MLLKLAWREVQAAKRRSILTILLSLVITMLLILFLSMMNGNHQKMMRDSVEVYTGYIQILGQGYHKHPSSDSLIFEADQAAQIISKIPGIKAVTQRLETFALYFAGQSSKGAMLIGIQPDQERQFSRIAAKIEEGEFLSSRDGAEVLIGRDFALQFHLEIGDELTYLSAALDSSMAADIVRVKGIFKTGFIALDSGMVFFNKTYLDQNFLSEGIASHLIVLPQRPNLYQALLPKITKALQGFEIEVISWRILLKSLVQALVFDRVFGTFSLVIFILVILFVIMIYSLVSIYTRTRELGLLRALGTTPTQIFGILSLEALIIGLIGVLSGGVLGSILAYTFQVYPITLSSMEEAMRQYGLSEVTLTTLFSIKTVVSCAALVLLINWVSILYPALRLNRLKPVDALKSTS
jgi:ABC-type lipoprotein release transport system permease subunit